MARPRLPDELRPVERTVRLSPAAYDLACQVAAAYDLSPNAMMKRVLEFVFTHQKTHTIAASCYRRGERSSTLSAVLASPAEPDQPDH